MRWGIASKFALIFSLLVLVATGTVGLLVYHGAEQTLVKASTGRLAHTAETIRVRFLASIEAINNDVQFLAEAPPVPGIMRARAGRGLDRQMYMFEDEWRDQLADIFEAFLQQRPSYFRASFVELSGDGRELVRVEKRLEGTDPVPATPLEQEVAPTYFRKTSNHTVSPPTSTADAFSPPGIELEWAPRDDTQPDVPTLRMALPVYTPNDELFGFVSLDVDLRRMLYTLQGLADEHVTLYLADQDGYFLIHPDSSKALGYNHAATLQQEFPQTAPLFAEQRHVTRIEHVQTDGPKPAIAYFEQIPFGQGVEPHHLVLGITSHPSTILAGMIGVRNRSMLITLMFCLGGIVLALLFSSFLTRPLSQITRSISRFGREEWRHELPVSRRDEIGVLARAFESMARQIQNQVRELEEKELRQRIILETSAEGIIVINTKGIIETFNSAAERIFGYRAEEAIGKRVDDLLAPPEVKHMEVYNAGKPALQNGRLTNGHARDGVFGVLLNDQVVGKWQEVAGRRKDDSSIPLSVAISDFELHGEHKIAGFLQDVTERKQVEEALRQHAEWFSNVFRLAPFAIMLATPDEGYIIDVNERITRITGYAPEEVLGLTLSELGLFVPSVDSERLVEIFRERDNNATLELQLRTKAGERRDVLAAGEIVEIAGGGYLLMMFNDITERTLLEQEVVEISTLEKRRIGQDLHDDLGQQLTGLRIRSENLAERLEQEGHEYAARARPIAEQLGRTVDYTRRLSHMLSPVDVPAEGLMDALEKLADNTEELLGIECRFEVEKPVLVNNNEAATHLYHIAQEAMNNAIKHSNPTVIVLSLKHEKSQTVLRIQDNGKGIPEEAMQSMNGMGLRTMRYRSRAIGAFFNVRRGDDGGTVVECFYGL